MVLFFSAPLATIKSVEYATLHTAPHTALYMTIHAAFHTALNLSE